MSHTSRTAKPVVLGATLATLFLASGCSTVTDTLGGDKVDYRTSGTKTVRLDVPPDLSQLPGQVRYGQQPASSISASALRQTTQGDVTSKVSVAANTKAGVRLAREGQNRWLVINQPADKVWERVSKFWEANGFTLAVNQPEVGIMETTWAENRAKVPKDGLIRQTMGRVFDMLYDTGERDMYRTRIERTGDVTEVYVSHRGMSEEYEDSRKERTTWRARPSDPDLEAEMLARLMLALGGDQDKSLPGQENSGPAEKSTKASPSFAQINAAGTSLTVQADADTTWRRVGLALDRSGFTVEGRDRRQGTFEVRLSANDPSATKPGFFSKLFGNDKAENSLSRYLVQIQSESANNAVVNVLDEKGQSVNTDTARRIAQQLLLELN